MATTKKSETGSGSESKTRSGSEQPGVDPRGKQNQIEERRLRRENATTVDGTESHQPEDSEAVKAENDSLPTGGYATGSEK